VCSHRNISHLDIRYWGARPPLPPCALLQDLSRL
jgi:hypothetical protein